LIENTSRQFHLPTLDPFAHPHHLHDIAPRVRAFACCSERSSVSSSSARASRSRCLGARQRHRPVKDARDHCGRDDCVAGVVGLELRNPCAIYVLDSIVIIPVSSGKTRHRRLFACELRPCGYAARARILARWERFLGRQLPHLPARNQSLPAPGVGRVPSKLLKSDGI
jgi:hypothetical protein